MGVKIEKQYKFPYIEEFERKFPITEDTIFIFKDTIYANNEMPYDILEHEIQHLKQQMKIGAKKWIRLYLTDREFRLKMELDAYKAQMKIVKKTNDKEEYAHILMENANNISSKLYGELITYQEAIKLLK